MIVEIEEFSQLNSTDNSKESNPSEKTVTRFLLRPNSETLFADLCLLNQKTGCKWTDKDALEIEAKILVRNFDYPFSVRTYTGLSRSSLHHRRSAWTRIPALER